MAADQCKRRPSSVTTSLGCGSQEQYRVKKREFRSLQCDNNYDFHVSLKWDDNDKLVVAKENQIGISPRHLVLFGPVRGGNLADVISVPNEAFELDDLTEVLTTENWQSLQERDKIFLGQFLPPGFDCDEVVKALLGCENFHFGNPFLIWGSSLCSGDLHPDVIVQYEKSFKANKKAYYSKLLQYHDNMIRNLKNLKCRCESSKDPGLEFVKIMSSSKEHTEKNVIIESHEFDSQKIEATAMNESTSSIADDRPYYSDNQKLSVIRDAEIQRRRLAVQMYMSTVAQRLNSFRIRNQELTKDKHEKLSSSPNGLKCITRPKKSEKSQKANIILNDGTKYMSYMKISKKQHEELVKSLGQSGSSVVQPKNLNRLLGNLDSYHVRPYVMFGEEAQKIIHEHWTNLVKKDLPEALEKWRSGQLERLQIMGFLCQELEDKQLGLLTKNQKLVKLFGEENADAEDVNSDWQGTYGDKSATCGTVSDDGDKPTQCSSQNKTSKQSLPLNINPEFDSFFLQHPVNVNKEFDTASIENQSLQNPSLCMKKEFDPSSMESRSLDTSPGLNQEFAYSSMEKKSLRGKSPFEDNQEHDPMDLNVQDSQVSSKNSPCSPPEHHVNQNHPSEVSIGRSHTETQVSALSDKVMWSSMGLPEPYGHSHHTTPPLPFSSSSDLAPLRHPQLAPDLIVLDRDPDPPGCPTQDLLNSHTNPPIPTFINPCANQETNEWQLQSVIQRDRFHQQQNTSVFLHPANAALLEPNPFHGHIPNPSFAADHMQRIQSAIFTNQIVHDNIYSLPSRENFSVPSVRDWGGPRIPLPIQSELNHSWLSNDNRAQSGWSAPQGTGTVFSTAGLGDQSLLSVLSQCNSLQPRGPLYNPPLGLSEQMMIPSTSYGQDMGTGIPMTSNLLLPQTSSPFDYLSGGEASATATLKNPVLGWMGLGNQPSGLHDPSGKPFLKPWDQ